MVLKAFRLSGTEGGMLLRQCRVLFEKLKTKGRRGVGASKKIEGKSNGVFGLGTVNNRVLLVGWVTGNNNVVSVVTTVPMSVSFSKKQ